MGFFSDFKKFLLKGDIVALATAVVIGGALSAFLSKNSLIQLQDLKGSSVFRFDKIKEKEVKN